MSTGAECNFTEVEPGRWKYSLQRYPYGETDDFDEFGPFAGFERAYKHLHDNHANPGGFSVGTHEQHVHEWTQGGEVVVGHEVQIRVESLGADVEKIDLIRHIQALPPEHPAFRTWPVRGYSNDVTTCASCHAPKENTDASRD